MLDRRRLSWVLSVPLMVAGSAAAHSLGSLLASPVGSAGGDHDGGTELTSRAAHGPMSSVPVIAGLVIALVLLGLCARIYGTVRGRRHVGVSPLWFLALPPVGFAVQELAERLLHAESFPFNPAHEPAFVAALLLQVPFGFLAFLVGRALLGLGARIARILSGSSLPSLLARAVSSRRSRETFLRRIPVLTLGHSVRGPPATALSS